MYRTSNEDKVLVVLLTYNSVSKLKKYFDRVLCSILAQDYPDFELAIVDNCSLDDTVEYIKLYNKNIKILKLRKNYGWGGGNNRGAILSKRANLLLFLNDDIILENNCISEMVCFLNRNTDIAAIQPLIYNMDGTLNLGCNIGVSGIPEVINRLEEHKLFYVTGAAMLTRKDIFFEVGMFDEDLFFWHDDLDYCWRLRLAGYKVACLRTVKAYHYNSATLGQRNPILLYYLIKNNIWVLAKCCSLKYFIFRAIIMVGEVFVSYIIGYSLRKDYERVWLTMKGLVDGLKRLGNAFIKRKYIRKLTKENDRQLIKMANPYIDIKLFFPPIIRKALRTLR